MAILLISDNEIIQEQTNRVLRDKTQLYICEFNEYDQYVQSSLDMVIIDFNRWKIEERAFKILLDIKCKVKEPILAILEKSSITDKFEVLSMGALDFLECPISDETYLKKIEEFYRWRWYNSWLKKQGYDSGNSDIK